MKTCPSCAEAVSEIDVACPWCQAALPSPGSPASGEPPITSRKAFASFVLGLFFFFLPAAVLAVIFGHLGRADVRRSRGRLYGSGMAMAGLVLGYFGIALIPLIFLFAIIAVPTLMRSRVLADEASAVGSLRTLYSASIAYSSAYGNGFPPSLAALGPATSGAGQSPSCDQAELIDGTLASGAKAGYVFAYVGRNQVAAPAHGCGAPGFRTFMISADPAVRGTTGQRSFLLDSSGIIRYNFRGAATPTDPPLH
jgi:type IV pilus assembly protein PilA